jgi:hypothetical protein
VQAPPVARSLRKQRPTSHSTVSLGVRNSTPIDLHVMAVELVEFRRLYHRVGRSIDNGTNALEQVAQSIAALGMPLDRVRARDALMQLHKEPRGPSLNFADFCRVMSKLRRAGQSTMPGAHLPSWRTPEESFGGVGNGRIYSQRSERGQVSTIDEAIQVMAVRASEESLMRALPSPATGSSDRLVP